MTYTKYIEVNLCCFIPGKVFRHMLPAALLYSTHGNTEFSMAVCVSSIHNFLILVFVFKVIDEVLHVLRTITNPSQSSNSLAGRASGNSAGGSQPTLFWSDQVLRTHEVLQELRDISSMAIDHFEEKIAPTMKKAFGELPTRSFLNCVPQSVTLQRKYACMHLNDNRLFVVSFKKNYDFKFF